MKKNEDFKEEAKIVNDFDRKGIILSTQNGKINYNSLRGPLSESDRSALITHKEQIIAYLEYLELRCRSYIDRYRTLPGEAPATFQQDGYRKFYAGGDLRSIKPNIFSRILSARALSREADENIIEEAIDKLCKEVEAIRSDLFSESNRVFQIVNNYKQFELLSFDVANFENDEFVLDNLLSHISSRSVYPLFNSAILSGYNGSRCLVTVVSHLIFDLWSKNILENWIEEQYDNLIIGSSVDSEADEVQYTDYANEQKDITMVFRDMKYWSHNLNGARPPGLPISYRDRSSGTFSYADHFFPEEDVSRLSEISKTQGTTLSVGMLSLFAASLRVWSGDDDLIINTTYNGRNHEKFYQTMGLFAGRVPVRINIKGDNDIYEIIEEVIEAQTSAWSYSVIPTQGISEILELSPGINKIVFNSSIEMGGSDFYEKRGASIFFEEENSDASRLRQAVQAAHFRAPRMEPTDIELIFYLSKLEGGIAVKCGYSNRFDKNDIEELVNILKKVVRTMASTERATIQELLNS